MRGRGTIVAINLRFLHGTGADQAHFAAQHIDQLRQFIKAGRAQEAPNRRDARVILQLAGGFPFSARRGIVREQRFKTRLRISHHGPELEAAEQLAAAPHALMREEGRATIGAHHQRHDEEKGGEQHQPNTSTNNIKRALRYGEKRLAVAFQTNGLGRGLLDGLYGYAGHGVLNLRT